MLCELSLQLVWNFIFHEMVNLSIDAFIGQWFIVFYFRFVYLQCLGFVVFDQLESFDWDVVAKHVLHSVSDTFSIFVERNPKNGDRRRNLL